jgi:hypothetical protein
MFVRGEVATVPSFLNIGHLGREEPVVQPATYEYGEIALMRHKFLVLVVALIIALMMGTAAGPPWAQNLAGCDGNNEGDHGRGCLPTPKEEECKEGAWGAFNVFEYIFEKVDVCN